MLLCDQVVAMRNRILAVPGALQAATASIQRIVSVADTLPSAPRFILANDVTEALITSSIDYPEALTGCIDAIRIPWRCAWFEWDDDFARDTWRRAHVRQRVQDDNFMPKRVGFIVETDESGRRGEISVLWPVPESDGKGGLTSNYDGMVMSNLPTIHFDLDRQDLDARAMVGAASLERATGIPIPVIGFNNDLEPGRARYLDRIRATMMMDWSNSGVAKLITHLGHYNPVEFVSNAVADIWSEYCMLVPAAAMMNARQAVRTATVDRARLNKARVKSGRSPLLDHLVVSMNVSPEERAERRRVAAGGAAGPRATHWVRGHLVHRGGTIFWRRPHIRIGVGDAPVGRTVRVHGQPEIRPEVDDMPTPGQ